MKGIIKKYYKEFIFRGMIVSGFGPLILAVIYAILGKAGVVEHLTPAEVSLGIVSITILAFIAAAMTAIYQIEELPLIGAILLHAFALYIAYAIVYVLNNWLSEGMIPFLMFTVIFFIGFVLIWFIVYLCIRKKTELLNKNLQN